MFDIYTIRRMNAAGSLTKREVIERFGTSPKENVRRVANNTWRQISEHGVERIIFHKTAVLTVFPDGAQVLNTGGWDTVTTKDRINRFARDIGLWSERGTWYVRVHRTGAKYPFLDGMVINPDGSVLDSLAGAPMEPLPEGSATLAARMGNLVTQGIHAWQDAANGGEGWCGDLQLQTIIDKLEAMGLERTAAWDVMDPHVHEPKED